GVGRARPQLAEEREHERKVREGAEQVDDPDVPAEVGDEPEEETAAEGLFAARVRQGEDLGHEADEGERPDPESDPGDEVEDARERRQKERAQDAHAEPRLIPRRAKSRTWRSCSTRPRISDSGSSSWGGSRTESPRSPRS